MSSIITSGYGSGLVITSGYGAQLIPVLSEVGLSGPMIGGATFNIIDNPLNPSAYGDTFPGVTINPGKWNTSTYMSATVAANDGLVFSVGKGDMGLAHVQSVATYGNFDVSMNYSSNGDVLNYMPVGALILAELSCLSAITGNKVSIYCIWEDQSLKIKVMYHLYSPDSEHTMVSIPASGTHGTLRIVRYGGRVRFYCGSQLVYDFLGWNQDKSYIRMAIGTETPMPINFTTTVKSYVVKLLIVFGNEICESFAQYGTRITGSAPAYRLPETVNVSLYTPSTGLVNIGTYTYIMPNRLTISASGGTSIVVDNDGALRDTTTSLKGLRL